jgi:dipeptide/tripeptide permease
LTFLKCHFPRADPILFWAFFEQSGGSLSLFAANNLNNELLGVKLDPNGVNNSANSLFVIVFAASLLPFRFYLCQT